MWQQAKIVIHFWKNRTRFGSPPIGPIGRVLEIPTSARFCFSFTFIEFSQAEIFPCIFYFWVKQLSRNFSGAKINQQTNQPPSQAAMSFVLWYWQHLFSLRPVLSLGALLMVASVRSARTSAAGTVPTRKDGSINTWQRKTKRENWRERFLLCDKRVFLLLLFFLNYYYYFLRNVCNLNFKCSLSGCVLLFWNQSSRLGKIFFFDFARSGSTGCCHVYSWISKILAKCVNKYDFFYWKFQEICQQVITAVCSRGILQFS